MSPSPTIALAFYTRLPVRSLSLGQRMRADLGAALLHDPEILFLDESTIGLDVLAKEHIRQFIKLVNRERHTTVILTTHDLRDIGELCNRVILIDKGRLVFDGDIDALLRRFGGECQLVVEFVEEVAAPELPGARLVASENRHAVFAFPKGGKRPFGPRADQTVYVGGFERAGTLRGVGFETDIRCD